MVNRGRMYDFKLEDLSLVVYLWCFLFYDLLFITFSVLKKVI
ncbi:hypothetical protein MPR_0496 [Myroides profundi]|nr:hypothetical protein MPR_0496 [Myroides profundi]